MKNSGTYGAEIEKAVSNKETNLSHGVSQKYFERLYYEAKKRKDKCHYHFSDVNSKIKLGVVSSTLGEQGLDNGFNLLETAFSYTKDTNGLEKLQKLMFADLQITLKALSSENATIINMANHPLGKTDLNTYKKFVAPKGIYPYVWYRGWNHASGIDANAQNCPTTGISVNDAVDAFSVILGASAAIIGIYGNSPFDEGKLSPYKESRLGMWDRMFKQSKSPGDYYLAQLPPFRFRTLAQYFQWMFGKKTNIHFLLADSGKDSKDYKGIKNRILVINNNPSVLEYLSGPEWEAIFLDDILKRKKTIRKIKIKPNISHMEILQFTQFAGVRIRYGLQNENFPLNKFLDECKNETKQGVEGVFKKFAKYIYIEGRDPGANFPDQEIWEHGKNIAQSTIISPSVIQAGLLKNLKEASRFIDRFNWNDLGALRKAAIKDGLQGEGKGLSVYTFAKKTLEIAGRGLSSSEQKLLAYPEWVLKTKKNGADRAIDFIEDSKKPLYQSLKDLVKFREVIM